MRRMAHPGRRINPSILPDRDSIEMAQHDT